MKRQILVLGLITTSIFLGYQNCSNVGFTSGGSSQNSSAGTPPPFTFPGETGVNGIKGGHFDLDTSTQIYPTGQGTTDHHVHEYDKSHQTTTIDFFNLIDTKFDNIQATIPAGKRFVLNVVNGSLSTGGILEINGALRNVASYQNAQVYTIGSSSHPGDVSLSDLRLGFSQSVLSHNGLIGTATNCVRANDAGKLGEYRNGALAVQALDADNHSLDPATGAATSGLLWEATVFWHWDGGCY